MIDFMQDTCLLCEQLGVEIDLTRLFCEGTSDPSAHTLTIRTAEFRAVPRHTSVLSRAGFTGDTVVVRFVPFLTTASVTGFSAVSFFAHFIKLKKFREGLFIMLQSPIFDTQEDEI